MATIGVLGMMPVGCGECSAAKPPPPWVAPYSADEALAKLRGGPCAQAVGSAKIVAVDLRGFEGEAGEPVAILDVEIFPPASPLGLQYRARTSVGVSPATGDVLDAAGCAANLHALAEAMSRAVAAAEASPEVARLAATHVPAASIQASFESWPQPRGRIVYVAPRSDGERDVLVWE